MQLPDLTPAARWGVCVLDGRQVLVEHRAHEVHRTASVGKLLLLAAVAHGLADGTLHADEPLSRTSVAPVADSGLWQHLRAEVLPLADVAALVGAVSDNLATNVLLERVGLPAVDRVRRDLGLVHTALHDAVRDQRRPQHPPTLSTGSARELAGLLPRLPAQVRAWLAPGADLSMVASAFGLDPLAHTVPDRGLSAVSKTGTDTGVRADVGVVAGPRRELSYAVLAEWDGSDVVRDDVLAGMRAVGEQLRNAVQL